MVLPNLLLRRARDMNKVATNFDVRAIDNREIRSDPLDEWNQTRHLRII